MKKNYNRAVHAKLHKSVTPFTAGTKPEYYYLFIVDMAISFAFIAFLGTLARSYVELQITLSIIMAVVQLVVPAALRPYEDEQSTRKLKNILNRRRHLVLLAKNQEGLNDLYKLVSESYQPGNFYRYPRVDYAGLKKYGRNLISTSACLGGVYAGNYWENREDGEEAVLEAMRETSREMIDIFGDRWYAEVQWNNIKEQHELNQYVVRIAEEFGIKLVSTADSHYPRPDAWKDRELYKRLAWLGKKKPEWMSDELPQCFRFVCF